MADIIAYCTIVWVVVGFIAVVIAEDCTDDNRFVVMAFFWPVTVPLLIVFGTAYAIFETFRVAFSWFRS